MLFHSFFHQKSYWGKVIGTIFGSMMGGPAGALFGLLVGNFFDKGFTAQLNRPYLELNVYRQTAIYPIFIKTTFQIMGHLAKADGRVSESAIQYAKTVMKQLRLNKAQIKAAQVQFNTGKSKDYDVIQTLITFKQKMGKNQNLLHAFLTIQYQAAMRDGISFTKLKVLNRILQTLGYAPVENQYHYRQADPFSSHSYYSYDQQTPHRQNTLSLANAFSILNVNTDASKPTVKQAYRRLMSQNHPDKLMAQGKSEHEIKQANDKTQRIRKAYETICAIKGW